MTVLYDDGDGVRSAGTLRYMDTALGVRRTLSGGFRLDTGTEEPPPPPPPPPPPEGQEILFGLYPGQLTDAGVVSAFGALPHLLTSYWQPANYTSMTATEGSRMSKGVHVACVIAAAKDTTANPNGSRDAVVNTIAGNPPNMLIDALTRAQNLAKQYPNSSIMLFPMGEMEVAYNQTQGGSNPSLRSLFNHFNNNETQILTALGQYVNAWHNLADEIAPNIYRGFFMGGSNAGTNVAKRNTIYSQITNPPHFVPGNPYNNNRNLGLAARGLIHEEFAKYRNAGGVHNSHWVRWGRPRFIINEIGIADRKPGTGGADVYTEQERAAWISTIFEALVAEGYVRHCAYFNSEGPQGVQRVTGFTPTSPAQTALAGEFQEAKAYAAQQVSA